MLAGGSYGPQTRRLEPLLTQAGEYGSCLGTVTGLAIRGAPLGAAPRSANLPDQS